MFTAHNKQYDILKVLLNSLAEWSHTPEVLSELHHKLESSFVSQKRVPDESAARKLSSAM